jgi:hypothetical protein
MTREKKIEKIMTLLYNASNSLTTAKSWLDLAEAIVDEVEGWDDYSAEEK